MPLPSLGTIFGVELTKVRKSNGYNNIFTKHGFSDEFGITPHQFRHYLDDAADRGGVPHKMINLWSGRKDPDQLLHYLHKTDGEKSAEISGIMFKDELTTEKAVAEVSIRVKSQIEFEELTDSAATLHSTGICTQNLVMSPCEYLNDFVSQCPLCKSSCHIAHDKDAIALLSEDLKIQDRRLHLVSTHKKFVHSQAMRDWFKIHHQNTELLRQLIDVLSDPTIRAGSVVRLLTDKNEMRVTNLETKTVEKKTLALPKTEKALQLALKDEKEVEEAKNVCHIDEILTLIGK